jgi:hypothetical protein
VTGRRAELGHLVRAPRREPWIPQPPGFYPAAPILLPDLATLRRVLEALRRL